jgi:hypothetical protein
MLYPDYELWAPKFTYLPVLLRDQVDFLGVDNLGQNYLPTVGRQSPEYAARKLYRDTLVQVVMATLDTNTPEWVSACVVNSMFYEFRDMPQALHEYEFRIVDLFGDEEGPFTDSPIAARLVRIARTNEHVRGILERTFGADALSLQYKYPTE